MNDPVPFFRPNISEAAIDSVADSLRNGWLTTGPKVREFEKQFAEFVGGKYAVAVNSATAALHLSLRALGLQPGEGVLVPTHTFAATAEVVQYHGGIPILVDCHDDTLNIDLAHAEQQLFRAARGELPVEASRIVGVMPVHVAGNMINMDDVEQFAKEHDLWVVEDAAHAFPAGFERTNQAGQTSVVFAGGGTAKASCFSFYANKTITTGEGGMLVTDDKDLADEVRCLSLHGLSSGAWSRFEPGASWDYKIIHAGYKYNLTDLAAAIGLDQLSRAEDFRAERQTIAEYYFDAFAELDAIELPQRPNDRLHSWHLFIIKLNLATLLISRNEFCELLKENGVGFSVHWRPLHLHPLYQERFQWSEDDCPVATKLFDRIISLPIFPGMTTAERERVVEVVRSICDQHRVPSISPPSVQRPGTVA